MVVLSKLEWTPEDTYEQVLYLISKNKIEQCADIGESAVISLLEVLESSSDNDTRIKICYV